MRSFARSFLAVMLVGASSEIAVYAENRDAVARAAATITKSDLSEHVSVLADDTFEGREAGSRGGRAAGTYLAKKLEALSLKPVGDGATYFQSFGQSRNLLAMLEGSDPKLKQEVIVVGAHYDHVGYGSQRNSYGPWGYIHNGADDNASGTAALLEVAQAMKELPEAPRRSVLFALWDGEEKGLLGSKHWCSAPTIDLSRVKLMINSDMIGRLTKDRVEVYGVRTAPGLRGVLAEANREQTLQLDFLWTLKDDSDHWPFFARGIPIVMFHTGLHADYHRPSDDVERVNFSGAERVARLAFETVHCIANQETLPSFRAESRRETERERRVLEQPGPSSPPRLGLIWDAKPTEQGLIELHATTVHRGSAAEIAGIRVGDIITALGAVPISDEVAFRQQILAAESPVQLTVSNRGQIPRMVNVKLLGSPIRVGFAWREDAGEPGSVVVSNVVFGSPAHVSHLQVGDRVIRIGKQPFADGKALSAMLDSASDCLELTAERQGVVRELTLQLPAKQPPSP